MGKYNLVAMTGKDSPRWSPMTESGYFERAKELGFDAVAITGITLYSLIPAWKQSKKTGVKLIVGATIFICENPESSEMCLPMHIYAKDDIGYKALCRVLTESQKHFAVRNDVTMPTVSLKVIQQYFDEGMSAHEHVYALSGGINGVISGGVYNTDDAIVEFINEKKALIESCQRLIGFMKNVEKQVEEATSNMKKLEALSKKDLSYKEDLFEKEEKRLKSLTDPDAEDVKKFIKGVDDLEAEKEAVKNAKKEAKVAASQVKQLKKQFEGLVSQAQDITGNMDCDSEEKLEKYIEELKSDIAILAGNTISDPDTEISNRLALYKSLFGKDNFFLEVQNHGKDGELTKKLCDMAIKNGVQIVATNNVIRLCKHDKELVSTVVYKETKEWRETPEEEYFKDDDELKTMLQNSIGKVFTEMAMANRQVIADNCNVGFDNPERHFPSYDCKEINQDIEKEIAELVEIV